MNPRRILKFLKSTDLPYIAALFICCIIAYWPVSFFVYSLKNDALNYFLPVRYQVSEAISNGQWPFWSPYFNLGYPLHGDMQSGVWNPIVQFISLFGPYTLKTLQFETLFYVFIGGVGMFYLLKYFKLDRRICLLIGVSYMLCGYISDSAQFLNWICSASFLPLVILFAFRTINEDYWRTHIFCGFFLYLFFVSAYPADFIILIYLLLIFFVWQLYQAKFIRRQSILPPLKKIFIAGAAFTLLSLPAILSYLQFLPLTERGSGASYVEAMSNPLHPLLFFSYVTPLGVWKAPFVNITDPLERNLYFGLVAFAFLIAGFFLKGSSAWLKFCKWGFIISIIFSMGSMGGLRSLAYYVLPLMDSFRHPANAKIFTIFFACNIAAFSMKQIISSPRRKILTWPCSIISLTLILLGAWSFFGTFKLFHQPWSLNDTSLTYKLKEILNAASFPDLLLINIFIQLPFLLMIYFFSIKKIGFSSLLYVGIINSILHSMLFMPFTVVKKDPAYSIQNILDKKIVKGYPLPNLNSSIKQNSIDGDTMFKEIGALNMYNKKIGRIDYRITPSNLNIQNSFWNDNIKLRNFLIEYPLLYKADTVLTITDTAKIFSLKNKKVILANNIGTLNHSSYTSDNYTTIIKKFTPNRWDMVVSSGNAGVYCLFQNYYPSWKLYIDGKESPIIQCNISFMGFKLDKGTHTISFIYEALVIKIAFLINFLCLLTVLVFTIKSFWKKCKEKKIDVQFF
jgi:hypothetical protein